jgi:hypothetical protein
VVGDLEEVDVRKPASNQRGIDAFLDVAGEQEPTSRDFAEQHDRDVVDARPRVGRLTRNAAAVRPQHDHRRVVDGQSIARREQRARGAVRGEATRPRGVAGPRAAHPGLEHLRDAVALEEQREAGHMILVGMGQHERIDPPVPRRQPFVERDDQAIGIRATVDEQATAA